MPCKRTHRNNIALIETTTVEMLISIAPTADDIPALLQKVKPRILARICCSI
ncbi:hypothetical protein [Nostoc sp.]|uniref:hypothetical protein n=1 Tax=Nostoc sp. TaxID=1180 RepID=UPI002FFB1F15